MEPILARDLMQESGWATIVRLCIMYSSGALAILQGAPVRRDAGTGVVLVGQAVLVFRLTSTIYSYNASKRSSSTMKKHLDSLLLQRGV